MKNRKLYIIIASLSIILLFSGCMKDEVKLVDPQKFNRPLNFAAPIFNAHLSAEDLISRIDTTQFIYVDDKGLIHARIDTSFSVGYDEVIDFDDMKHEIALNLTSFKKSIKAVFSLTDTIPAALIEGQRFDSVTIETAEMKVTIETPNGFTGKINLEFPEITLQNGNILKFTTDIDGTTYVNTEDLAGSTMKFFQNNADISSFSIKVYGNSELDGIPTETELKVSIEMLNFKPNIVYGYFGRMNVMEQKNEMEFDFFKNFNFTDMIQFKDVTLKLITESYFGLPVSVLIDSMVFKNTEKGDEVALDKEEIKLDAAILTNGVVEPDTGSLTMQLAEAINIAPNKIYYEVNGWINPDGDIGNQNFMINDGNTTLNADMLIEIPFWFKTENYQRTDTINFDVKKILDTTTIDYVEEINIYFDFNNGFPFSIYAQAYMVDAQGVFIDSLFAGEQTIWKSPDIGTDGKAGDAIMTKVDISLDNDKVKKLYDNDVIYIFIKSRVQSGSEAGSDTPTFVKLFTDYTIDISMAIDIKSGEL